MLCAECCVLAVLSYDFNRAIPRYASSGLATSTQVVYNFMNQNLTMSKWNDNKSRKKKSILCNILFAEGEGQISSGMEGTMLFLLVVPSTRAKLLYIHMTAIHIQDKMAWHVNIGIVL